METDNESAWRVVIEFTPSTSGDVHPERHTRPWGMRLVATDPTGSEIAHVEEEQPEPLSLIAHAVAEVADTLVAIQRREESDAG